MVTKLSGSGRENGYVTCVIAKDGTDSAVVDIQGFAVVGLLIPTIDTANLTFKVSNLSDGDFYTVKDKGGASSLTIATGTGAFAVESTDLDDLRGYRYIQIIASAGQTTADVTFVFVLKG